MGALPPVRYDRLLYAADVPALPAAVRTAPPEVGTLLLLGHNPGLEELVVELAGEGPDDRLDRLRVKFPTSAIAVLAWHGAGW